MILHIEYKIRVTAQCDAEPRCVYPHRAQAEFYGYSLKEAIDAARNAGWTVGGPLWWCPTCQPSPGQQTNLEISPKGVRRLVGGPPGKAMPADKPKTIKETEE